MPPVRSMTDDTSNFPALTQRQEEILSLIVRAFTQRAEPVSSKQIVTDAQLGVSSATVRNEMAHLEEMGYITAPHTSAGRIPTALGYRYFVKWLMNPDDLSSNERQHITRKFNEVPPTLESRLRQAATVLARTVQTASLVTQPLPDDGRFKHLELISIHGRMALLVLVMEGGTVQQRMLSLAEPLPQDKLSQAAQHINQVCDGMNANKMRMRSHQMSELEREVIEIAADLIERADRQPGRVIYREGLSEILESFQDSRGMQQAVRIFEQRAFLDMILSDLPAPQSDSTQVHVIIAGDGRWQEMNHLSVVLSRYGMPGMSGAVGILGPTHLNYGRAIYAVQHVSNLMTDYLVNLYDGEVPGALPSGAAEEEDEQS